MDSFTLRATSLSDAGRKVADRVTIDEELARARHTANCMDLAFNAVLSAGSARAQAEAEYLDAMARTNQTERTIS